MHLDISYTHYRIQLHVCMYCLHGQVHIVKFEDMFRLGELIQCS